MSAYPQSITNLIRHIARLPGIGEKTAERLALHILRGSRQDAEQLAQAIVDIKTRTRLCQECFGLSDQPVCRICADPTRQTGQLCVVEQPGDMMAIDKSGAYAGRYFILGGTLSPMNGIGPDQIRIRPLLDLIRRTRVTEVIVATSTSVEGEATADFLAGRLRSLSIAATRIASGVPMGGDLKFVDQVTLKKAMEARHAV